MYPDERSLVEKYENAPFAIVGVNSDDSIETLQKAMKEEKLPWSSFFDGGGTGGPIATQWGVRGWPTIYVIDHEGVIRHQGRNGLHEVIDTLVREAQAVAGATESGR